MSTQTLIDEAEQKHGENKNFKFVKPGVKVFYSEDTNRFFEMFDDRNPNLVEELIYKNRKDDLEIPFVNGIYLGNDNVKNNPIKHRRLARTKSGETISVPVYNIVKYGYSPIDEGRFYFYKSLVNEMGNDQRLRDKVWQMFVDGTFLAVIPPIFASGSQRITSDVIYPGAITTFEEDDVKITPIQIGSNLTAALNVIQKTEEGEQIVSNISQFPAKSGTTAREIIESTQQAKIAMGLFIITPLC